MCGLCGELRFDAAAPDRQKIERMKARLRKRGPDAEGSYFAGPLALGHRRLAIIDLTDKAAQPMTDETAGCCICFRREV